MFESENRYFQTHKAEFLHDYAGKYIVLQGESVKGNYDSMDEAFTQSSQQMQPGTFAIKHVVQEEREPYYLIRVFVHG